MARSWPRPICVWTVVLVACSSFLPRPSEVLSVSRWEAPQSRLEPGPPPGPPALHSSEDTQWQRFDWSMTYLHNRLRRTQNAIYLCYLNRFSSMGVHRAYKAHFHSIFLSLCRLDRIIVVPAFINGDRLVACFIFGTACPGILAFYPLEGKKKKTTRLNRCFWHFVWCFPRRSCSWDMLWEVKVGFFCHRWLFFKNPLFHWKVNTPTLFALKAPKCLCILFSFQM